MLLDARRRPRPTRSPLGRRLLAVGAFQPSVFFLAARLRAAPSSARWGLGLAPSLHGSTVALVSGGRSQAVVTGSPA